MDLKKTDYENTLLFKQKTNFFFLVIQGHSFKRRLLMSPGMSAYLSSSI